MTLFTTLLVLFAERLFKLGEHWQLDHRLEALFRRVKHYSLAGTLVMTIVAMAVVGIIQRALSGVLFNVPSLISGFCWGCCASVQVVFVCIITPI